MPHFAVGDQEGLSGLRQLLVRGTLAPWLASDTDRERASLLKLDAELSPQLAALRAGSDAALATAWCERWRDALPQAGRLSAACGRNPGP